MKIQMSYGEIDLDAFVDQTRVLAHNISPNNPWEKSAVDWTGTGPDSVVVEVGAYHGLWCLRMAEKYHPKIFAFEPQIWCIPIVKGVLQGFDAKIFPFGLGKKNGTFPLYFYETDGCTFENKIGIETPSMVIFKGKIKSAVTVFEKEKIANIDIMDINAEGVEYDLIPFLFKSEIFPRIILFQGHDEEKEKKLRKVLEKNSYHTVWDYGSVYSAWER